MTHKITTTTIVMCALTLSSMAQRIENNLKVKGIAEVKATPTVMQVNIPIEAKDADYETCTNKLTHVFNDLNGALTKAGIDKKSIKSGQLRINEDYKYVDRERVLVGYVGSINMNIEMKNSAQNLHQLMQTLNDPGFKFGYNVGFALSENQKDSLRQTAIENAVADAQQKAEILANAMHVKIGDVYEINYEYGNGTSDPLMRSVNLRFSNENEAVDSQNIDLNPDEITLTKSVDVIWLIGK